MNKKIIISAISALIALTAMEAPASAHQHKHNADGLKFAVAVLSALGGGSNNGGGVNANGGNGGICILSVNSCNGGNGGTINGASKVGGGIINANGGNGGFKF